MTISKNLNARISRRVPRQSRLEESFNHVLLLKEQLWRLKNNSGLNLSRIITFSIYQPLTMARHCANLFIYKTNSNPYNSLVTQKLLIAFY